MARRRKRQQHGEAGGGAERWLLTYADMITLLLALFIVMFAMSEVDPKKFETLKIVLSDEFATFAVNEGDTQPINGSTSPLNPSDAAFIRNTLRTAQVANEQREQDQKELSRVQEDVQARIESTVGATKFRNQIETISTERGLVIRLRGDTFFPSGSAAIDPAAIPVLRGLGLVLARDGHNVAVEGHTDGVPLSGGGRYQDNWELSGARANAVLRVLLSSGMRDERIRYTGFADTRPAREPQYARQSVAQNRRVEIVVLTTQAASTEGFPVPAAGGADLPDAGFGAGAGQTDVIGDVIGISQGMGF